MHIRLHGKSRRLGDHVNTDYIISSARKRETVDSHALKRYLLETIDANFAASVQPGDLLVAGKNFGCGSAMEVAVTTVLAAEIKGVLAQSFARTYYRNAINNGLVPIECDTRNIQEGDRLTVTLAGGSLEVRNETRQQNLAGHPLPAFMLEILGAGGLAPYLRQRRDFPTTRP